MAPPGAAADPEDLAAACAALVRAAAALEAAPNLAGARVLLRCDLNAPLDEATGEVADAARIDASLPAIELLLSKGARVAICSHLGRPEAAKGAGPAERRRRFTLAPVARALMERLGAARFVGLAPDCVGPEARAAVEALADGQAVLLENVRLHPGEAANDPSFAAGLAELADVYVGDAFAVTHRDQASVTGAARLLPVRYPGPLVSLEVSNYLATMVEPRRPLGVAIGGAKVKDKIGVLRSLIRKADVIVVGGRMAFTFLAGVGLGAAAAPQAEPEWIEPVRRMVEEAEARGVKLLLPVDVVATASLDAPKATRVVDLSLACGRRRAGAAAARGAEGGDDASADPWAGCLGADIGPATSARFREALAACRTLFWNGPMGRYEVPEFGRGTADMVAAVCEATRRGATTCIGGGDTLAAFHRYAGPAALAGPGAGVTFASTGGGASLELLEGRPMPGLRALLPDAGAPAPEGAGEACP